MKKRPPIVTILGHVDHGKTSLLESISGFSLTSKEQGGITQTVRAYQVKIGSTGSRITFIDTPGHEAFDKMRSRGAKLADLALLVVAADDGPKPQTIEALSYIRELDLPFIVVITKIDLASADTRRVLSQLEEAGVFFEGRGGNTSYVEVSNKTGKGIEELLEMINLVYAVAVGEQDVGNDLEGVVLETMKDKRGFLVHLLVRSGVLRVGDTVDVEGVKARVRGLFTNDGTAVVQALAGEPVFVLGFSEVVEVGGRLRAAGLSDKQPAKIAENQRKLMQESGGLKQDKDAGVPVVIKADSAGGLEAIEKMLPDGLMVVDKGIGDVNESDIFMAKTAGAEVVGFNCKIAGLVKRLAETEGVKVSMFFVIYELIDYLNDLLIKDREEVLGRLRVLAVFPFERKLVAGCKVEQGVIRKTDKLVLKRGEKELACDLTIVSFKHGKQDIQEAKQGEECGILFEPQVDFREGDVLVSVKKKK